MSLISVSNAAELTKALSSAKGGETILLAGGDYGDVIIKQKNYTSNVTLMSAGQTLAHINTLRVSSSSNITFKNLEISAPWEGKEQITTNNAIASVTLSNGITFDSVKLHGSMDGNPQNDRYGLSVSKSQGVNVVNSEFQQLARAVIFDRSSDIAVLANSFHDLRMDGLNFSEVQNVVVDSNYFTDFYLIPGDHADAIQFWTSGRSVASSNIRITNNQILQGRGSGMQGIFMRDEVGTMPYENVTIDNNLVYGSELSNGISITHGKNVNVTNNTVVSPVTDKQNTWIRLADIDSGTVSGNVTDMLMRTNTAGMQLGQNLLFENDFTQARRVGDINAGADATPSRLAIEGIGYQLQGNGKAVDLTQHSWRAPEKSLVLLDLDFSQGTVVDRSTYASSLVAAADNSAIRESADGAWYQLAGTNGFEIAARSALQIYGLQNFTLSFDLKRDKVSTTEGLGYFMSHGSNWNMSLTKDGTIAMFFGSGASAVKLVSSIKITDTAAHSIDLSYNGKQETATLFIDGKVTGAARVPPMTSTDIKGRGLYVGYPTGTSALVSVSDISIREIALSSSQVMAEKVAGYKLFAQDNVGSAMAMPLAGALSLTNLASTLSPIVGSGATSADKVAGSASYLASSATNPLLDLVHS